MASVISLISNNVAPNRATIVATAGGCLITASIFLSKTNLEAKPSDKTMQSQSSKIPVDFMERIMQKPYISDTNRIPKTLRIMSIDIPEMRDAFDGDCQLDFSKIYPDEIAPAKKLGNENTAVRKIMQKSFVKSFVRCKNKKKIGVELLEASVSNLNPKNMRKTYQVGNLIKYNVDEGRDISDPSIKKKANKSNNEEEETSQVKKEREGPNVLTNEEDVDAPWNQYAWIEELQLRVSTLQHI